MCAQSYTESMCVQSYTELASELPSYLYLFNKNKIKSYLWGKSMCNELICEILVLIENVSSKGSLHCLHTQRRDADEGSGQFLGLWSH